jgi:hypothetical protein
VSLRRTLEGSLAKVAECGEAAGGRTPAPCLRIRAFDLVRVESALPARAGCGLAAPADGLAGGNGRRSFHWTARTARRRVGLAAVRSCLAHPGLAPADAVALVVADPTGPAGIGPRDPGSCADWLASLSPPARAVVQAEAAAWATAVWTAIEWDRVHPDPVVGGPDRWWDWRGPVRVALQGRADVRLPGPGGAHFVVLDGVPSPAARRALSFSALVDALRCEGVDTPARVIGWWPQCGKAWVTPANEAALRACAEQVVRVVHAALRTAAATEGAAGVAS